MLGLFLAAVLFLSSCIAAPPGNSALPTDKGVSATDIYEIRLPYLDSASEGPNSQEFLAVTIAADNGILLANDSPIFPPSVPMQLNATRHGLADRMNVSLSFATTAKSLSSHRISLDVTFLGPRGETVDTIAIDLVQDPEGNLLMSDVRSIPTHGDRDRPWQFDWSARANSYLMTMKHSLSGYKDAASAAHCGGESEDMCLQDYLPLHIIKSSKPANLPKNMSSFSNTMIRTAHCLFLYFYLVVLPVVFAVMAGLTAVIIGFMFGCMLTRAGLFIFEV